MAKGAGNFKAARLAEQPVSQAQAGYRGKPCAGLFQEHAKSSLIVRLGQGPGGLQDVNHLPEPFEVMPPSMDSRDTE